MLRKNWRAWMVACGVAVFAIGAAQAQSTATPPGPDYWPLVTILLGLVVALIGAYAKGLEKRLSDTERALGALQRQVDRDYHPKSEIGAQLDAMREASAADRAEIMRQVAAVHRRLDFLRVPPAPKQYQQDDGA